jgi:hypothetical protein
MAEFNQELYEEMLLTEQEDLYEGELDLSTFKEQQQ